LETCRSYPRFQQVEEILMDFFSCFGIGEAESLDELKGSESDLQI
jgi:hypothetical protein